MEKKLQRIKSRIKLNFSIANLEREEKETPAQLWRTFRAQDLPKVSITYEER